MPSIRTYNQTAPFWDFIADLENQGNSHPFFNANRGAGDNDDSANNFNPWAGGFGGWPFGPMPHRGKHGGAASHHQGPPPPPNHDHQHGPPPPSGPSNEPDQSEAGPSEPRGPPPPFSEEPTHHGHGQHRRHGRCGSRGGWGGRGRGGPRGFPMGGAPPFLNNLAEMFQSQLFGGEESTDNKAATEDFKPEVDIFDTADSFVVHISLPGAKKEDVGVNWDAEKSELSIAGVIYRPGDEELLKTLALDERRVGAFERKVRLGSRASPAQVDVDGISARMEDGVLRVEVPKLDSGYVEIKKVDIE